MKKVYDKVWIMSDNRPREMLIYSVSETMDTPTDTVLSYTLVTEICGAGQGRNRAFGCPESEMFNTKAELLESL